MATLADLQWDVSTDCYLRKLIFTSKCHVGSPLPPPNLQTSPPSLTSWLRWPLRSPPGGRRRRPCPAYFQRRRRRAPRRQSAEPGGGWGAGVAAVGGIGKGPGGRRVADCCIAYSGWGRHSRDVGLPVRCCSGYPPRCFNYSTKRQYSDCSRCCCCLGE